MGTGTGQIFIKRVGWAPYPTRPVDIPSSGRRTRLEHGANDRNGLNRAIMTNLTTQSSRLGR